MEPLKDRINGATALIFDLDGTLVDTKANNRRALFATFAGHGVRPQDMPSAPEGTGFVDWCALLIAEGLLPPDVSVPELEAVCERETLSTIHEVREIPAVAELARWAKGRLPLAIATGSARSIVDPLLAATGLAGNFDVVVTRDEVTNGKPAPDLFLRAAGLLAVAPRDCLVLEDTEVGLEAARHAGMAAIDVRPYGISVTRNAFASLSLGKAGDSTVPAGDSAKPGPATGKPEPTRTSEPEENSDTTETSEEN